MKSRLPIEPMVYRVHRQGEAHWSIVNVNFDGHLYSSFAHTTLKRAVDDVVDEIMGTLR